MRRFIALTAAGIFSIGTCALIGCASDAHDAAATSEEQRTRPSVDLENGGGMNRTGAGAENGSSTSGMDRAGGGFSGSKGANSGAVGTGPGTAGTGAAGPGGAPTPGR